MERLPIREFANESQLLLVFRTPSGALMGATATHREASCRATRQRAS
jgi:hypothetical protein